MNTIERGKLFEEFNYLDKDIIYEIYRSLNTYDGHIFNSQTELTEKLSSAVAFCQLLKDDPENVTDFHKNRLTSLFTGQELIELQKLIVQLTGIKISFASV